MSDPLARLKRMVETGNDLLNEAREASERDRDYYDGQQWTDAELAVLKRRRQPAIVINRVRRKIDGMVGIEQRSRVDPRAYPREPGDEDAAELATKALIYVEQRERIDVHRSAAFENLLVEGYGGVEVVAAERSGKLDVKINRLRWEEIVFDPHSREKDFSDASWTGIVKWMARDTALEFAAQFVDGSTPEGKATLEEVGNLAPEGTAGSLGLGFDDDRPGGAYVWQDKAQKRVRVCQLYHRQGGEWRLTVFTGRVVLYDGPSPYLDEEGRPANAMILMAAYVDRENRRYGVVRDMIGPQDEVNKRRSKALHQSTSRQTVAVKGAIRSVATLKRELADPAGHVEVDADAVEDAARIGMKPFDVLPQGDQSQAHFALLQEAKQEIDGFGPNPALLGQGASSASGRAIMAQQQAGLAELAPIYDSLRDWTERVYRAVWARIRQTWDDARWIRVTEDNEAPQFLGINQPMTDEYGYPQIDPATGQPVLMNAVGELDVDIIVDQAPEYATLRAEQFETLANLAQSGVPIPPQLIVEASDLRDKRKLLEMLAPPAEEAAPPEPDPAMAELAMRDAVAEVSGKEAKAERDAAAAERDRANAAKIGAELAAEAQQARFAEVLRAYGL